MRAHGSLLIFILTSTSALAQQSIQLDLERLTLEPGSQWSPTVNSGDGLRAGQWAANVTAHFEYQPLRLRLGEATAGSVVAWRQSGHLSFAWGIFDGLEVGAQLPFFVQHGDRLAELEPISGAGVGTPLLRMRFTLLREEDGAPFDLGLSGSVGLPLGTGAALARDPASGVSFSPRIGLGKELRFVRIGAELGGELREGAQLLEWTTQRAPASTFTGAFTAATTTLPVQLGFDLRITTAPTDEKWSTGAEFLAHARLPIGKTGLTLDAIGGPGFGKLAGTPAFRAMLGLTWRPSFDRPWISPSLPALRRAPLVNLRDFDRDGVSDDRDLCPTFAGVERYSGCPFEGEALVAARAELSEFLTQEVHFQFDSAGVELDQDALAEAIDFIEGVPDSGVITIEGHTDSIGSDDYNQALSIRRAESIRAALIAKGVAPERLRVVGRGKSSPEVANVDATSRARNRRVRFIVEPSSQEQEQEVARAP
ncbi:MAG: OmpA family protein [Archangium sp.]